MFWDTYRMQFKALKCVITCSLLFLSANAVLAAPPAILTLVDRITNLVGEDQVKGAKFKIEPFRIKEDIYDVTAEPNALGNQLSTELFLALFDKHDIQAGDEYRITGNAVRMNSGFQLEINLENTIEDRETRIRPFDSLKETDLVLLTVPTQFGQEQQVKESMTSVVAMTGPTADYTPRAGLVDPTDKKLLRSYSKSIDAVKDGKVTYQVAGGYLYPSNASTYGLQLLVRRGSSSLPHVMPISEKNGQPFVDLQEGDRITVKIINRRAVNKPGEFDNTVGAMLFVDGMNWLQFSKQWKSDLKLNVHPGREKLVEGWHINGEDYKEFLVSSRLDQEATSNSPSFAGLEGLIQLQIFEQGRPDKGLRIGPGGDLEGKQLIKSDLVYKDHPVAVISVRFTHPGGQKL